MGDGFSFIACAGLSMASAAVRAGAVAVDTTETECTCWEHCGTDSPIPCPARRYCDKQPAPSITAAGMICASAGDTARVPISALSTRSHVTGTADDLLDGWSGVFNNHTAILSRTFVLLSFDHYLYPVVCRGSYGLVTAAATAC